MVWTVVAVLIWLVIAVLWWTTPEREPVLSSPATTFAFYNVVFTLAALLFDGDFPIYGAGLAWMAAATLVFWMGYGRVTGEIVAAMPAVQPARPALWIGCLVLAIVGLAGMIWLNAATVGAITEGQDLDNIADQVTERLAASYDQYESGEFIRTGAHTLLPFTYASAMLGGMLFGLYPSRRILALALAFAVPIVGSVLTGARSVLVLSFVLFFGALIAGRMVRSRTAQTSVLSVGLSVLGLVVAVTVIFFWRWGNLEELGYGSFLDRLELGWRAIQHGGFAPIPQFSEWLADYWTADNDFSWGARLFRGPAGLLGLVFGFSVPRVFEPWLVGPNLDSANIFSVHRVVIEDFGLFSIVLFYLLGRVARLWQRRALAGSLLSAVMFGAVYTTIFVSVIDFPFNNTVVLAAIPLTLLTIILAQFVDRIWTQRRNAEQNLSAWESRTPAE